MHYSAQCISIVDLHRIKQIFLFVSLLLIISKASETFVLFLEIFMVHSTNAT